MIVNRSHNPCNTSLHYTEGMPGEGQEIARTTHLSSRLDASS